MSDTPSHDLLKELEKPGDKPAAKKLKAPPMPKAVAERLNAAKAPTLTKTADGKTEVLVGDAKDVAAPRQDEYPDIPEADRVAFLAHILGSPRFLKPYELFGGELVLVFRTRTAAEDEACTRQASADVPLPELVGAPEEQLKIVQNITMERIRKYQEYAMLMSLDSIRTQGVRNAIATDDMVKDVKAAYDQFIATANQTLLGLVRLHYSKFEGLVNTMLTLADKPGFWKAASPS